MSVKAELILLSVIPEHWIYFSWLDGRWSRCQAVGNRLKSSPYFWSNLCSFGSNSLLGEPQTEIHLPKNGDDFAVSDSLMVWPSRQSPEHLCQTLATDTNWTSEDPSQDRASNTITSARLACGFCMDRAILGLVFVWTAGFSMDRFSAGRSP